MAYENFIPRVWAKTINRELERKLVFAEDCNRQYDGDVKKMGYSVRILGVGKPTITTTTNKKIVLSDAEDVDDTSVTMLIKQIATYNYKIDDIDKRQAVDGVMDALSKETTEGLGNVVDKYIAELALDKFAIKDETNAVQVTKDNILNRIDAAIQKLYEKDVSTMTETVLTVSPRFYMLLKQAYTILDTDNSRMLENGRVGKYGNVTVKMSNNVAKSVDGLEDKIMLRTKRAIAYVHPMTEVVPYKPEKSFSDAVKGFILFDAQIVRPKEMIIINAKY